MTGGGEMLRRSGLLRLRGLLFFQVLDQFGSQLTISLFIRCDIISDKTIEPVVFPAGEEFPYIHAAAAAGRGFGNFTAELFGEIAVIFLVVAVDRQAAGIAWSGQETFPEKGFPEIRIVKDVADGTFFSDVRDHPVKADFIALVAAVFGKGALGGGDALAFAGEQDRGVSGFAAKLKDGVGGSSPA